MYLPAMDTINKIGSYAHYYYLLQPPLIFIYIIVIRYEENYKPA